MGSASLSVRQLSAAAGSPPSAIYYHFGSLEQLFALSQEHAIKVAERWCEDLLSQFALFSGAPGEALAPFLAGVIDGWCEEQRQLAFAWREGQLLGARDDRFAGVATRWRGMWLAFWQKVCARFDLGPGQAHAGVLTARLFESESLLHMFRWRRAIDRPALEEFCRGWTWWMLGRPLPSAPWRDFARSEALRDLPPLPELDETTARIARAAARIVDVSGVAALTHRAVAGEAGLTLGVVSHKLRTSAELLHAAFEEIYRRSVSPLDNGEVRIVPGDIESAFVGIGQTVRRNAQGRGGDELMVATARDPSLRPFAAQLRYLRGRTSRRFLVAMFDGRRDVSDLEAALYSGFISGQIRSHFDGPEDLLMKAIRTEVEQLAALAV